MNMGRTVAGIAVVMAASGCGSFTPFEDEYACGDVPGGAGCVSAREVYDLTTGRPVLSQEDVEASGAGLTPVEGAGEAEVQSVAWQSDGYRAAVPAYVMPDVFVERGMVPVRAPAQVVRVWVAPFEDTGGSLVMPGLVYSEVVPRRWSVGNAETATAAPSLRPLEVPSDRRAPRIAEGPPQSGPGGATDGTIPVSAP